jgi:hypothetical protein
MLYDFSKGNTANKIIELTKFEIARNSQYSIEPIKDIEYSKIKNIDKRFFYINGEDVFLMFAYKKSYNTIEYNALPKYHVCQCKTRNEYNHFTYASSMPVEVYCRDQKKKLEGLQQLKLCSNCASASQKNFYRLLAKGKPWYEYVIQYANSQNEISTKTKSNGYVVMWKQISEAIRERVGFCCEKCKINLNKETYYLEVHHKDFIKMNNASNNLIALCVLCHATIDEKHLSNFKLEPLKVESFNVGYAPYIEEHNKLVLQKWKDCK